MIYFLNYYLYDLNHTLYNVQSCGEYSWGWGPPKACYSPHSQSPCRH